MLETATLVQALRAGVALRDKVVVLAVDSDTGADAAKLDALAVDLALARALGIRMITVCDPSPGPGPFDAQRPALRLIAALGRQGEHAVALPAAGIVTLHNLPAAAFEALPTMPARIPVVQTGVLIHLSALGYLPVLLPPAADAEGAPVALGAGELAGFLARFMGAAGLLLAEGTTPPPADDAGLPPAPPTLITRLGLAGVVLTDLLRHVPPTPAPESAPVASR